MIKRVVSISLGSSKRNKTVQLKLGDQTISIARIGCDGDEKRARALFASLDGQVDAMGVGGVELYVRVGDKQYPLRSGLNLVKDVQRTPYTDGRGLKYALERQLFQLAEPHFTTPIVPRKAMMPLAADRFSLAESLDQAGFDLVFCDLLFGLGLPIPVKGLARLRRLAGLLLPVIGLMPISMLYPTGQNQDENVPKYEQWFNYGPVVAGDFLYIRRNMPMDLTGKIILTNTTTEEDVALLRARGVSYLVTGTPRLDGRSFGTNMMEAALIAYAGLGRPLTDAELHNLIQELGLKPSVQKLN
ncbi:MAG: quinate 5-dehydrogenase [Anaerolineae bacterium]|nr:quinate 5-dehydrogenase [Anaerolineae bacterium]MCB0224541.1 quinate 5-dehydrogenase [Anaerolineae bacterium]